MIMLHPRQSDPAMQSRSCLKFQNNGVGSNQPDHNASVLFLLAQNSQDRPCHKKSFHASVLPSIHPFHARVRVPKRHQCPSDRSP